MPDEVNEINTAKHVRPNEDVSQEPTPIGDAAAQALGAPSVEEYLKDVNEVDITHFDEDDDPLSHAGDEIEEDKA